jgi:hypothetical protein
MTERCHERVDLPLLSSEDIRNGDGDGQQEHEGFPNHYDGSSSSDVLLTDNDNNSNSNSNTSSGNRKCHDHDCSPSTHRIQQACFFVGSLFSTISSSIDVHDALDLDDKQQNNTLPPTITITTTNKFHDNPLTVWDVSKVFITLSTLLYLMDSLIHIIVLLRSKNDAEHEHEQLRQHFDEEARVAVVTQQQLKQVQSLGQSLLENSNSLQISHISSQNEDRDPDQCTPPISDDDGDSVRSISTSWTFSVLFGIAATFDLLSSMTDDDVDDDDDNATDRYPWPSFVFGSLCVDLFWACAVIALWNKRTSYYDHFFVNRVSTNYSDNNNDNSIAPADSEWHLLLWGDMLFFVGCTIDVMVNLADNPIHQASDMVIAAASLSSSLCWLVDAILYAWADADIFDTTATTIPASATVVAYSSIVTTAPSNI